MRHTGRITEWKDEQGFGFVTPSKGGPQVFVHVSAFSNRRRRPQRNDLVTYELAHDDRGRAQGRVVAFVGDRGVRTPGNGAPLAALVLVAAFVAFVMVKVLGGRLPLAVAALYLFNSAIAFGAYAFDKAAAKRGNWRVPESTLHLFGLLGGWPGALLAQQAFRHKSKKRPFQVMFWITVILNCVALIWVLSPAGSGALRGLPF